MGRNIWIFLAIVVGAMAVFKLMSKPSLDERAAARQKIKEGALVLDVRTESEYAEGHFENALNIPVQELAGRTKELGDKNRAIVVYCAAGARAARAKAILGRAGFSTVMNAGGLSDLQR